MALLPISAAKGIWLPLLGAVSLGAVVCLAVSTDSFPLLIGAALLLVLAGWAAAHQVEALIAFVAASVLLPVDLAFRVGSLPRLGPIRLLLGAFVLGALIRRLAQSKERDENFRFPIAVPFFLFSAWLALGSMLSLISFPRGLAALGSFVVEDVIPFYFLAKYLRSPGVLRRLKGVLYLVALLISLYAFIELATGRNFMLPLYDGAEAEYRAGFMRVRATFFHPIPLACFVNLLIPFVIVDYFETRAVAKRVSLATLGLMLVAVAAMTVSRVPLLILGLEITALSLWIWRKRRLAVPLGLTAAGSFAILLTFVLLQNGAVSGQVDHVVNPNNVSLSRIDEASSEYYRFAFFKAVSERLRGARWFLGVGPGAFNDAELETVYDGYRNVLTAPDSHYIKLLFEDGLVGLALFLGLMAACVRLCAQAYARAAPEDKFTALAALAAVSGFIVVNVTASMFQTLPLSNLFFMSVAISSAVLGRSPLSRLR